MKRKLLQILLLFLIVVANKNKIQAQIKFGIRAGVNSSTVSASSERDTSGFINGGNKVVGISKNVISYHVGLTAEISLSNSFSFQPSILYSGKGAKSEYTTNILNYPDGKGGTFSDFVEIKSTSKPFYIDIPLIFNFKKDLGAAKLLIGAGPYLAFGISGKTKSEVNFLNNKFSTTLEKNISWNESDYKKDGLVGIKRFDAGLTFNLGLEFVEKVQVGMNYNFGLTNINPSYISGVSSSSVRMLSLYVAVLFGK